MQKRSIPMQSGAITSYTHPNGRIGVLLEVACKSDFVARSEEFNEMIHDLALHIAAFAPKFIRKEDVLQQTDEQQRDAAYQSRLAEICLYEQPFIKDNSITVSELIICYAAKLREDIAVTKFARFALGDPVITIAHSGLYGQQPGGEDDSSGVNARLPKLPKTGSGAAYADLEAESGSE
jgi:elongation factor Ts